jgi:hypothetical protein
VVGYSQRVRHKPPIRTNWVVLTIPSIYTGPQTNDIINEIPSEASDDDCEEPDDFSV